MSPASDPAALPAALLRAQAEFGRHLAAERGLSPHTVRAYLGDIGSLLDHARLCGITEPAGLDVGVLRSWLARQRALGRARSSLARRGAAARTFTAFAHSRGWLASDPGPLLGMPKPHRTLPDVLRQDEMSAVLDAAGQAGAAAAGAAGAGAAGAGGAGGHHGGTAVALRDAAVMELLYATGIRVSELCGLDIGDVDHERRCVRVRRPFLHGAAALGLAAAASAGRPVGIRHADGIRAGPAPPVFAAGRCAWRAGVGCGSG